MALINRDGGTDLDELIPVPTLGPALLELAVRPARRRGRTASRGSRLPQDVLAIRALAFDAGEDAGSLWTSPTGISAPKSPLIRLDGGHSP
jgi:hypothetical protein